MKTTMVSVVIPLQIKELMLWGQERREDGALDGLWEFPGGKIEAEETPRLCAIRELKEEVGIEVDEKNLINFNTYPFEYKSGQGERKVVLYVYLLPISHQSEYLKGKLKSGWKSFSLVEPQAFAQGNYPAANKQILSDLAVYLDRNINEENWRMWWQQSSC